MEPDIVQDSLSKLTEEEIGKQLIKLRETDQIKELQTVLRDKYVIQLFTTGVVWYCISTGTVDMLVYSVMSCSTVVESCKYIKILPIWAF